MGEKVIGMGRKVVGPTGSRQRRWALLLSLLVITGAGLIFMRTVLAVHDTGAFQLDGDAATGTNTAGTPAADDDWDKVCYEVAVKPVAEGGGGLTPAEATAKCGANSATTGATAVSWVEELDTSASIFTGGGSKDPIDIDQWAWKDAGGLPDKDNLLHAYAARYSLTPSATCPSGGAPTCDVLYFGSDRFDNSGDATQGFWFLQNQISLGTNKIGGGTGFASSVAPEFHKPGDMLVISDFSNGGGTSTITIYRWDPTCLADNNPELSCDDTNLRLLANLTGPPAHCTTAGNADAGCGLVNPAIITMPWSFTDKSATPDNGALNGEFFEAGVNLSLLGLSGQCFATVLSETRSSTSTDAVLKDFAVGTFGACTSQLVTTPVPDSDVFPGATVGDSAVLTIGGATTWSGTLQFYLCSPSELTPANTGTCTTGGTAIGTPIPVDQSTTQPILSDTTTVTALGKYCWRGEFIAETPGVPDATDASEGECFNVIQLQPTIATVQTFTIKDTATIAVDAGAGNLTGSVRFRLYNNSTCDPGGGLNLLYDSGAIAVSGPSPQVVESGTTTITTSKPVLSWLVEYTSTNAGHNHVTSACNTENASLTINNGPQ